MISIKKFLIVITAVISLYSGKSWSYDSSSPAAQIVVNYIDAANVGFNDPVLGTSRKTALEYALNLWAAKIKGTVIIRVDASCQSKGGTATSAVLASAGPLSAAGFPVNVGLLYANTYYPMPLINQYTNSDNAPTQSDIQVIVNSDVDNPIVLGNRGFYYGINASPGANIDFVTVLLHELGHGFGFLTFMDSSGALLNNLPDGYMRNLIRQPAGTALSTMDNAGRLSAITSNALYWDGASLKNRRNLNLLPGNVPYGKVKMYAPSPYESGSSVSHFDISNSPNLLMEPAYTGASHNLDVTGNVLHDIGWYLDATALPVGLSDFSLE